MLYVSYFKVLNKRKKHDFEKVVVCVLINVSTIL